MLWEELSEYVNSMSPKLRLAKKVSRILIQSKCFVEYGWKNEYPEGHYMSFVYFDKIGKEVYITSTAPKDTIVERRDLNIGSYLGFITKSTHDIKTIEDLKSYVEDFMKTLTEKEISFLIGKKLMYIEKDFS